MADKVELLPAVKRALAAHNNFVLWEDKTKLPLQVYKKAKARTNAPTTWASYEDAYKRRNGHSLGFVFSESDPFCGIDLDKCVEDGDIHPDAQAILDKLDSYAEFSPSGTGIHIWVRGHLGTSRNRNESASWGGKFEVYDRLRFFTLTGAHVPGTPTTIRSRQKQLDLVVGRQFGRANTVAKKRPHEPAEITIGERYPAIRALMCGMYYRGMELEEIKQRAAQFNEQIPEPVPPEQWDRLTNFVEEWLPQHLEQAEDEFWNASKILRHIRQHAQANLAAPLAVLGCTLARVSSATPYQVVLPGRGAGANKGSLNFFCALVGEPGTGKDQALSESEEAIDVGDEDIVRLRPGSGEGISHAFKKKGKEGEEWVRRSVLFQESEIETLDVMGKRQGSTLFSELRNAWSGGVLGHAFVDPQKRLNVKSHSYRLALVVGVQPTKAGQILADVGGGFPQRIIWCTVADPYAPAFDQDSPGIFAAVPSFQSVSEQVMMPVCARARAEINEHARVKLLRPQSVDPLRGHWLFTKLKVAALLAILHGATEVDNWAWDLADFVMTKSDEGRALCSYYSWLETERDVEKDVRKAKRIGVAQKLGTVEAEAVLEQNRRTRCEDTIKRVCSSGKWIKKGRLSRACSDQAVREVLPEVLSKMVETGRLDYRHVKPDGPGRPSDEYKWVRSK